MGEEGPLKESLLANYMVTRDEDADYNDEEDYDNFFILVWMTVAKITWSTQSTSCKDNQQQLMKLSSLARQQKCCCVIFSPLSGQWAVKYL